MVKLSNFRSTGFLLGSIILSTIVFTAVVFGAQELGIISDAETNVADEGDSDGNLEEIKQEIYGKIDILIGKVENSPDDCWWDPVDQRKSEIINKSIEIKDLIALDEFKKAYNKVLHEIKPKLTGLNTDENEEVWGDGIFYNAWVICDDLKEEFRIDCNEILTEIKILIIITTQI